MVFNLNYLMKKILLILICCFTLTSIFGQLTDGPKITVNKMVYDFGEKNYGEPCECEFIIKNEGNQPLNLYKCKGSCGCTVPTCDPTPILPGNTYIMVVTYDSKREGPINKSITINSNAVNEPYLVVRIKGNVQPDPSRSIPEK